MCASLKTDLALLSAAFIAAVTVLGANLDLTELIAIISRVL